MKALSTTSEKSDSSLQKQRDYLAKNRDYRGISTQYEAPVVLLKKWVDFEYNNYTFSIVGGDVVSLRGVLVELGITTAEEADEYIAKIESVEFSDPALVAVRKVEEDTTAGAIRAALGVETVYSAELTDEAIAAMNEREFKAVDWALVSLQAFNTEETLTITMTDGKQIVVKVTDAYNNPVTLHFVDESGEPITVDSFNGQSIPSGTTFTLSADWLNANVGANGELDLTKFTPTNGYTLSNTHKSTSGDLLPNVSKPIFASTDEQPHSIIGNELKWENNTLKYKAFYTNNDKAGSDWYEVGTRPSVSDNNDGSFSGNTGTSTYDGGDNGRRYDYYLVYSPTTAQTSAGGGEVKPPELGPVGKDKHMTDNEDGTYTLELSVDTKVVPQEEDNKVNIIIVLDTSSSMERDKNDLKQGESKLINGQWVNYDALTRRMTLTVQALNGTPTEQGFLDKLASYNTPEYPDTVEVGLITFDATATRQIELTNNIASIETKIQGTNASSPGLPTHSGTNWADALQMAMNMSADGDPTYVLFMTDGAPSQYWHTAPSGGLLFVDGQGCYLGARDEARELVRTGKQLYGIFSFGTQDDKDNDYLGDLVDYAYNDSVRFNQAHYANNLQELKQKLTDMLGVFTSRLSHTNVNVHDGIALDTTSTALSANVSGTLGGITYTKTDGRSGSYSVTAAADGSAVFHIDGKDYPAAIVPIQHVKLSGTGENVTASEVTTNVYQCTVDGKTYTMPIASLVTNEETKEGNLNWDLSPLGPLERANYKISFVVWPNQSAYDYVADLNNGIGTWDEMNEEKVYAADGETLLYTRHGVAQYPNIIRYPNGVFAALSNYEQDVTFYKVKEDTGGDDTEPSYEGVYTVYPDFPDPMPLTATASRVEKVWNVERDPGILAQLLYDLEGNSTEFKLDFEIKQGTDKYTDVTLGWHKDSESGTGHYDWENAETVTYNGHDVVVGTRWASDFAIATGLMLSTDRMDALGLDKTDTDSYKPYTFDGETYYVLEDGHEYSISEPRLTYEFDFDAPKYHPMLVDGELYNVTFTETEGVKRITGMKKMEVVDGQSSLKIENTLRGYINLDKVVLDRDGTSTRPGDNTKFEYEVILENSTQPGPFTIEGSHVPWYGISGLFYHDSDYNYYQAEPDGAGKVKLKDESGRVYDATCSGTFAQDVGPTAITYTDSAGTTKTIQLYGNQMVRTSDNYVSATLKISQAQTLNIANVPAGTQYTIREHNQMGYQFVRIDKEIRVDASSQPESSESKNSSMEITGTIVANRDNHITYYNKLTGYEIELLKVDAINTNVTLDGVTFELYSDSAHTKLIKTITTAGGGKADLGLLDAGTYYLVEKSTKPGYNPLTSDVTITISEDGEAKVTYSYAEHANGLAQNGQLSSGTSGTYVIQVGNNPGVALPSTGSTGTGLFTALGGLLTLGAGLLLLRRRRLAR